MSLDFVGLMKEECFYKLENTICVIELMTTLLSEKTVTQAGCNVSAKEIESFFNLIGNELGRIKSDIFILEGIPSKGAINTAVDLIKQHGANHIRSIIEDEIVGSH